jgi:OTU domain-containing protein 5
MSTEGKGETKINAYSVGDKLDVLDETSTWVVAKILDVVSRNVYKIHYLFFSGSRYDQIIDLNEDSSKIAPYGQHTFVNRTSTLQVNQWVDVFDIHPSSNKWLKAKIIAAGDSTVRVHFWNYSDKFDETIKRNSRRIAPYGHHTMIGHVDWEQLNYDRLRSKGSFGRRGESVEVDDNNYDENQENKNNGGNNRKRFKPTPVQLDRYQSALARQNLEIVGAEMDGNCLFRTVSHQLYGTQEHHALIRQYCVDYMASESAFFSNFVALSVGGFQTFDDYLGNMRLNGVWGDEPEIQAMCEIYDRPADVYVYDEEDGCRIVRRMHDVGSNDPATRQPLRLSFYGGGHYDSLVNISGRRRTTIREEPGVTELRALETARARLGRGDGENVSAEQQQLEAALRASRLAWDEHGGTSMEEAQMEWAMRASKQENNSGKKTNNNEEDLQRVLIQSMDAHRQKHEEDELQKALHLSKELSGGSINTEEEQIRKALEMSKQQQQQMSEEEMVRVALEESHKIYANGLSKEDEDLQRALMASQTISDVDGQSFDDDMKRAMEASLEMNATDDHSTLNEDDEIQRAIFQSLKK